LFDDGDLRILMLLTTASFHSTVHDETQNKDHPDENSNSTAKNEGNGSTLPTTQIHEGVVDTTKEVSLTETVMGVRARMWAVMVVGTRMRIFSEIGA
jgi:hypothetical protein